jgi:hypothetical protein
MHVVKTVPAGITVIRFIPSSFYHPTSPGATVNRWSRCAALQPWTMLDDLREQREQIDQSHHGDWSASPMARANAVVGLRPGCHKAARQAAWQKKKAMGKTKPGASMDLP